MNIRKQILNLIMTAIVILPSFSIADDNSSGKLTIYTVNYPLQYFAERIVGEHGTVIFPAPDGVDPAYWMPDRKIISNYQKADIILLNGAHYAGWTEKVSLPRSKMLDTSMKFKDQYIRAKEAVTHSHGPGGEHAHEDAAFTIWLDLELAVRQAESIKTILIRKRPALRSTFERNYAALEKDLMVLDGEIKAIVSRNREKPLVASHPVYQYLAGRYGLNIRSVHWEPGETPDVSKWAKLRSILRDHKARWMIWEGEPASDTISMLQSMSVKSLVFDPCGNTPDTGDFLTVMQQNVDNLRKAFR